VDVWSIGTIFVELILRVPFLAGETDIDQLKKTFHAMGSPTEEDWPVRHLDVAPMLMIGTHQTPRLSRDFGVSQDGVVEHDPIDRPRGARAGEGTVTL
jgi:hypothetical protein